MSEKKKGEVILRLTKKDFRIDWFSGTGGGGQNRNKVMNCCRMHHDPSNTMAVGQDHRDGPKNLKAAFERLTALPEFKKWLKLESMRRMGDSKSIDEIVDHEIKFNTITEVVDEKGNWKQETKG
jgi:protein subunit release factor B